jgi:hypothetical protein
MAIKKRHITRTTFFSAAGLLAIQAVFKHYKPLRKYVLRFVTLHGTVAEMLSLG